MHGIVIRERLSVGKNAMREPQAYRMYVYFISETKWMLLGNQIGL